MVDYPAIIDGKLVVEWAEVYDGPFLDTDKGWGLARLYLQYTGLWDSTPANQGSFRNVANNHAEKHPKKFLAWRVIIRLKHGDDVLSHWKLGD